MKIIIDFEYVLQNDLKVISQAWRVYAQVNILLMIKWKHISFGYILNAHILIFFCGINSFNFFSLSPHNNIINKWNIVEDNKSKTIGRYRRYGREKIVELSFLLNVIGKLTIN